MVKVRKVLALVLVLALLFSMSGCDSLGQVVDKIGDGVGSGLKSSKSYTLTLEVEDDPDLLFSFCSAEELKDILSRSEFDTLEGWEDCDGVNSLMTWYYSLNSEARSSEAYTLFEEEFIAMGKRNCNFEVINDEFVKRDDFETTFKIKDVTSVQYLDVYAYDQDDSIDPSLIVYTYNISNPTAVFDSSNSSVPIYDLYTQKNSIFPDSMVDNILELEENTTHTIKTSVFEDENGVIDKNSSNDIPFQYASFDDGQTYSCYRNFSSFDLQPLPLPTEFNGKPISSYDYLCYMYCTIDDTDFNENYFVYEDGVLFDKDKEILLKAHNQAAPSTYAIPNTVKTISPFAFATNESIKDLVITDSTTKISYFAFSGCKNLTNIEIQNKETEIGYGTFSYCENLTHVVLPKAIKTIAGNLFYKCSSLESVEIPEGVEEIGENVFSGCTSLKTVSLPNSLTKISPDTFVGCKSLESITLPEGLTTVCSFEGCESLTSVVLPQSLTEIGSFEGCESLTSFVIPEGITKIPANTFSYCTNLTSVVIPDSVTEIEWCAFCRCENLTSIEIPNGVTTIESNTFDCCFKLENVVIPDTVEQIEPYAFVACESLENIVIPKNVKELSGGAFAGCNNLKCIKIEEGVENVDNWAFDRCENLEELIIPKSLDDIDFIYSMLNWESETTIYCTADSIPESWEPVARQIKEDWDMQINLGYSE